MVHYRIVTHTTGANQTRIHRVDRTHKGRWVPIAVAKTHHEAHKIVEEKKAKDGVDRPFPSSSVAIVTRRDLITIRAEHKRRAKRNPEARDHHLFIAWVADAVLKTNTTRGCNGPALERYIAEL